MSGSGHARRVAGLSFCAAAVVVLVMTLSTATGLGIPPPSEYVPPDFEEVHPATTLINPGFHLDPGSYITVSPTTIATGTTLPAAVTTAPPTSTGTTLVPATTASTSDGGATTTVDPAAAGASTTMEEVTTSTAASAGATGQDGGLGGGWIAFIVLLGLVVLGGLGAGSYLLGRRGRGKEAGSGPGD
jgi:hypothetical protein